MGKKENIQAIIDGGKASAGPPLGPKLGPLGVNIPKLIGEINEKTKDFGGMKVPITLLIDTESKTWEIEVGLPPTSQLIFKELKIEKGSGSSWREGNAEKPAIVADATRQVIVKVAKIKMEAMRTRTLKNAVKNVLGTCVSAGITVEGKKPQEAIADVEAGEWDSIIK